MHFFLPIIILSVALTEATGHPNPLALNMLRSLGTMRCQPSIAHFMRFLQEESPSTSELAPLRGIQGELETFLDSTCKASPYHPQCDIQPAGSSVFGQCDVRDPRELGHCAVTVVRSIPNCSLDVKCWHAESGNRFVNLIQEPDDHKSGGFSYTLTTDSTPPKFFPSKKE